MSDRNEAFDKWVSAEHCAEGETVDFCKMGLMREAWYVAWGKALERQAGSQAIEGEPVGWIVHCPRGYKNRPHAVLRSDYNVEAPEFWAGGKPPPDATVIRLYTHPASRQALEGEPTAVINKSAVGDYEFFPAPGAVDMPNGIHKLYTHPAITEPCRFHDLDDEACEQFSGQVPCEPYPAINVPKGWTIEPFDCFGDKGISVLWPGNRGGVHIRTDDPQNSIAHNALHDLAEALIVERTKANGCDDKAEYLLSLVYADRDKSQNTKGTE